MEIPGYKLVRAVEAGRVCTIYNALDIQHSKTVIVKVFNDALSKNLAFQNHFRQVTEHLINKTLGNNVHLLDAIVTDNACIIVTNYCPCSTQREGILAEYTEDKVIEIGLQLAASLSQLHNLGIVHGGVELSNIYFLDSGEVTLGTAALHRTIPGQRTSQFMLLNIQDVACLAPEANTGLTTSSDFFSLGVVLYELLTGGKPFNASSMVELEQQKKDGKYLPLRDEFIHLKPLFNGLLAPNPESRISSGDQFYSIVDACLMMTAGDGHSATQKQAEPTSVTNQEKTVTTGKETGIPPLLFAAVATIMIGVVAIIFMISDKKETPQHASDKNKAPVVARKPEPITEIPYMIQRTKEQTETNGFYTNAKALAQQGDYEAALQAINRALTIETDKVPVEKLKHEIERELKLRSFLVIAEQQFKDEKLILPPGDNAFESYQRVANLAPEGDERAVSGIQKIADHYLELAKEQTSNNKMDNAKKAIAQGLTVKSDYAPLLELKSSLAVKSETLNENNSQTKPEQTSLVKTDPQPFATEQREKTQQTKASGKNGNTSRENIGKTEETKPPIQQKQRAAMLVERIRTAQIKKAEHQAAQQRMLAAREAEIIRRLASAEQELTRKPVSRLAIDTAESEYRTLANITDNDSRVTGLYRKIVDSHITLANNQQNAEKLSESMETITRGLALDKSNKILLTLKNTISNAIKESEKKQNQVPVIGTF